jgi:hypothetical protein
MLVIIWCKWYVPIENMKLGVSFGWLLLNLYRSRLVFTVRGPREMLK